MEAHARKVTAVSVISDCKRGQSTCATMNHNVQMGAIGKKRKSHILIVNRFNRLTENDNT